MRKVFLAADLPEAYLVLHLLKQAGIEAHVFNQYAPGALGEIPFPHAYPEVWLVDERDEPRARAIVADYERRTPQRSGTRRCTGCGEENPPAFEICWHCGMPLAP